MNIIFEYICCLALGVWLFIGIYLLISEIISLVYIWKTNKVDNNFVRVDLPEHAGFGPFHGIWNPPYRYIRKDCLESEVEQSKLYVKVLKRTIKGKKLSRDELMLLLEKGFFELESAVNMPRHKSSATCLQVDEMLKQMKDKRHLSEKNDCNVEGKHSSYELILKLCRIRDDSSDGLFKDSQR